MTENDRLEIHGNLLTRLVELTNHISGKALCNSYMAVFKGVRVTFLEHLPPVPPSELVGKLCADVFVRDNGDIYVIYLEDASVIPKEEMPGVGYCKDIGETDEALIEEIANDVYQWLVYKKKPEIKQLLH